MSAAGDGSTEPNINLRLRRRCKRVSPLGPYKTDHFDWKVSEWSVIFFEY